MEICNEEVKYIIPQFFTQEGTVMADLSVRIHVGEEDVSLTAEGDTEQVSAFFKASAGQLGRVVQDLKGGSPWIHGESLSISPEVCRG